MSGEVPFSESAPAVARTIGTRSVVYSLGGLAYKGVAILALPILARLLSPTELGLLDLAAVLASIVGLVVALGADQSIAYLEPRSGPAGGVWTSALVVMSLIAGAMLAVSLAASGPIASLITGDRANGGLVIAAVIYGWVLALTAAALTAVRLHASPRTYAVTSFFIVTLEMAAALIIAWTLPSPVTFMVLGWAFGAAVVVIPLLLRYIPNLDPPRLTTIRRLAAFGSPLVPAAVVWLVGDAWIRTVLAQQTELSSLGQYGIGYRIASVATLAVTGFGAAWQPYIFSSPDGEVRRRTTAVLSYVILGLGLLGVGLTAFSPEVIALVAGPEYTEARVVVGPLAAGAVAFGVFVLMAAVVGVSGSTRAIAVAALIGMAAQIAVASPLVAALGLPGAGLASLTGYLVALTSLLLGPIRRRPGLALGAASLAVGIVTAGFIGSTLAQELPLIWRALAMAVYVGASLALAATIRASVRVES